MMNLNTLIGKISQADDEIIKLARRICHLDGLASIPYARNKNGGLERAFFVYDWTGHLNPHNHKYDIILNLVQGSPVNVITNEDGNVISKHLIEDGNVMLADEYHSVLMSPGDVWTVREGQLTNPDNIMVLHRASQPCVEIEHFKSRQDVLDFLAEFKQNFQHIK